MKYITLQVLKSEHCNYNDACNLVRGNIMIAGSISVQVAFKNCALFTKSITLMKHH